MSGERGPALVVRRPGEVVLEERGAPSPGTGEVLIRPGVVGLCGTDLDIVAGRIVRRHADGVSGILGGSPYVDLGLAERAEAERAAAR